MDIYYNLSVFLNLTFLAIQSHSIDIFQSIVHTKMVQIKVSILLQIVKPISRNINNKRLYEYDADSVKILSLCDRILNMFKLITDSGGHKG